MTIVTVGIDLAKNVFAVPGVDETGKLARVRPEVARTKLLELITNLPACLIGRPSTASAIVTSVGKGHDFTSGRQFCAWLGLVPGQYSSGGKQRLERMTKAGDPYLRTLLIMGGKAVLAAAKDKTDSVSRWALNVQARRGYWCAVVAVAAKNARLCWAMLQRGEAFRMPA